MDKYKRAFDPIQKKTYATIALQPFPTNSQTDAYGKYMYVYK